MEYVEGGDCATLVKKWGPLPFDLARYVPVHLHLPSKVRTQIP